MCVLRGLAVAALAAGLSPRTAAAASPLTLDAAIRAAWDGNPGIAASAAQVSAARADAEAARDARLPTLSLQARGIATDEPVAAFGLKLDEQRISQADFVPSRLTSPGAIGGVGLGAMIVQPIWMGGRLLAGQRAADAQAGAEAKTHERRRAEIALAIVQAYFGAQVAAQGLQFAEDQLQHAVETERFTRARNQQGLALDADVSRATAFRAQAEAERASARQQLASARSALVLLAGDAAVDAPLATPIDAGGAGPGEAPAERPDVEAARLRASAAEHAARAARGTLLPEILAQGGVETMRSAIDQGASWFTAALVARWNLSLGNVRAERAAEARAAAASRALEWQQRQARREVDEARRAVEASDVRVASAREAVSASEAARRLREARHRQGLLPLTDVLDAEAGLAGARALLLRSALDARVARAQLQLALGEPVEGVKS
jgi:outer membrane protein TolC